MERNIIMESQNASYAGAYLRICFQRGKKFPTKLKCEHDQLGTSVTLNLGVEIYCSV